MSERYSKLYSLPDNLYAEGSPLIIAAGSLLKDNQTGNVLAQIKFKSIADKTISALMVKIKAFDVTGKALKGVEEQQYLDLNVGRNQEFGQKSPIMLPENVTRSFECEVTAVIFSDDTSWKNSGAKWESLPKQELLKEKLGELNEQYLRDTECKGELYPSAHKDIWFCSCGGVNKKADEKCSVCSTEKEKIFSALDTDLLTEHKQEYDVAQAKKLADEAEAAAKEKAKNKKAFGICAGCFLLILIIYFVGSTVKYTGMYNNALALYNEGKYEEAISVFETLKGYKDSEEQIVNCLNAANDIEYNSAVELFGNGEYEKAKEIFNLLADYRDCEEWVEKIDDIINIQEISEKGVGDYVGFGGGASDKFKWEVIAKNDKKALLLLVGGFEMGVCAYDSAKNATWENCSVRKSFQEVFSDYFSETEQDAVLLTKTSTSITAADGSVTMSESEDRLFLLSVEEVEEYIPEIKDRVLNVDVWDDSRQKYTSESVFWWLRGSVNSEGFVDCMDKYGTIGTRESSEAALYRPAMWISFE